MQSFIDQSTAIAHNLKYLITANHLLNIAGKDLVTLNLHTDMTEIKPLSASGRGLERGLN
ncbi:MAG: hypothetical protein V7K50_10305 [Nostoc sp.]|uniref:hypothetical protein n=1 Tax=Nostoc sp. TaxID=1180 RepID=UPI002FFB34BE